MVRCTYRYSILSLGISVQQVFGQTLVGGGYRRVQLSQQGCNHCYKVSLLVPTLVLTTKVLKCS